MFRRRLEARSCRCSASAPRPASDSGLLMRLARDHGGLFSRRGWAVAAQVLRARIRETSSRAGSRWIRCTSCRRARQRRRRSSFGSAASPVSTVVLGCKQPESRLLSVATPGGTVVDASTAGLVVLSGDTWAWLRMPLPFAASVTAPGRSGSPAAEAVVSSLSPGLNLPAARFFVSSVIDGGPYLRPLAPSRRYYTGDVVNPLVQAAAPARASTFTRR